MSNKLKRRCAYPRCGEEAIAKVEDNNWLCKWHVVERIHMPHNLALTEAWMELDDFLDDGGQLS